MSLGLSMITNDAEATEAFIKKYGDLFERWFITVAARDKKEFNQLLKLKERMLGHKLELSYFKWTDDFAAARNHNLSTIDTDYWFWADSDDELINPERLPELVRYMQGNDTEVMALRYDYSQNPMGDAVADHWRERIIKRAYDGKWDAPVHETFQGPPCNYEQSDWVVVKHNTTPEQMDKSMARNEKILRKHFEETKDPRDASYLGNVELGYKKNYPLAIQWFTQHIKTSGAPEDMYRSWCRIAECEWIMGNFEQALYATDEAVKLRPDFPDAYYTKVIIYTNMEEFEKGIEWLKVAVSKPVPKTLAMIDPTLYKYRGLALGAQCYLFSGRVKEAFKLYQEVLEHDKELFDENLRELFETAYFDAKAIDFTKWLLHYTKGNNGKPLKIFDALPERLFADPRLNAERIKFYPKVKWPAKSMAIYCGPATESWGPDQLDKGMGGSEEAVMYLSREMALLGWEVTVFNDREEEYIDTVTRDYLSGGINHDGSPSEGQDVGWVIYKPWTLLNPYDEFDVFVAWRQPETVRGVKARQLITDLHDTIPTQRVYAMAKNEPKSLFFVKSKWHRDLYPELPDERFVVIGNGIAKEQFDKPLTKTGSNTQYVQKTV